MDFILIKGRKNHSVLYYVSESLGGSMSYWAEFPNAVESERERAALILASDSERRVSLGLLSWLLF